MSQMKSAAALVALVGAGSASTQAHALTTLTFDIAANDMAADVTVGSGAAQYTYGKTGADYGVFTALNGARIGGFAAAPGLAAMDTYTANGSVTVANCPSDCALVNTADPYLHLSFTADGQEELGYATFSSDGTLESLGYAAAPEPASWALLFGGVGLTGAALRRARRQAMLAAAS